MNMKRTMMTMRGKRMLNEKEMKAVELFAVLAQDEWNIRLHTRWDGQRILKGRYIPSIELTEKWYETLREYFEDDTGRDD